MKRLLTLVLFLVLALTLPPAAGAATTTSYDLTTSWTDLGAGPMRLQTAAGGSAAYTIADSAPADTTAPAFNVAASTSQDVPTTSHVWARAVNGTPRVIVAPLPGGSAASIVPTQGLSWAQPADVACVATTPCPLLTTTSRKYMSFVNTTATGMCRLGYGGVTPTATRGDPIGPASVAGGQGGSRTFESSYVPSGVVYAFCTVASNISVMEGN